MIKEQELLEAIAECQGQRKPNASTCLKLASYYTILDHITGEAKKIEPTYSFVAPSYSSDTEFGRIVQEVDMYDVRSVTSANIYRLF